MKHLGQLLKLEVQFQIFKKGDRVCMEPGIPDPNSLATKLGIYNVDPKVRFWATPPIHGCLTPEVVHPAKFTYQLPNHVTFGEGAMVEPFAIGMQAAYRAKIKPGGCCTGSGRWPNRYDGCFSRTCRRMFQSDHHRLRRAQTRPNWPI